MLISYLDLIFFDFLVDTICVSDFDLWFSVILCDAGIFYQDSLEDFSGVTDKKGSYLVSSGVGC